MPGMDGFEAAELIRQRKRCAHTPIIFLTAFADVPTTVKAMKSGAMEFLTKPFDDRELLDAIYRALERDQVARDFRQKLRDETRKLPEVVEIIAPLEAAAAQKADEAVAAAPDLDEAGQAALRKEILDEAERQQILPRLAEHEHKVWATVPRPEGVETVTLSGVSRSYARHPDDAQEAADSIERFLKTNASLFRLGVDGISETLRHGASGKTAVVRITGRSFPEQAEMLADAEGLETSRKTLAQQRETEARNEFQPDRMKITHQLQVPTRDEQQP